MSTLAKKTVYDRIIRLIQATCIEALVSGRYGPPYTPTAYYARDKAKAFKCIAYQIHIRNVSALEEAATLVLEVAYANREPWAISIVEAKP